MTEPEQALERARAAARSLRDAGAYQDDLGGFEPELVRTENLEPLYEWAMIEPDERDVRSTRPLGAPLTWIKRGLVRLLRQYNAQLTADQSRFNVGVVSQLRRLEDRIAELESRREERDPGG